MEAPNFIESYQTEQYDLCDRIVARLEEYLNANEPDVAMHHMVGEKTNGGVGNRSDQSFNFTVMNDPLNTEMQSLLSQYVPVYAEKYGGFALQPCMSQAMKVQKTKPKGGFHIWHAEHGFGESASYRNLTWTLYLNDVPDGEGETEFIEYGVKVQPKKGLLCFFPAGWTHTHRGNPVYTHDKYIATGWYYLVG